VRWLIAGVSIALLFSLQLALADLQVFGSAPNLALVYLCLGLAYWRLGDSLYLAAGAGALLDVFSALPDGIMLAGMVIAVALSEYLCRALFSTRLGDLLPLVQTILASILFFAAIMLVNQAQALASSGRVLDWGYLLSYKLGADVILNVLAVYPVHLYFRLQQMVQVRLGVKLVIKNEPI